MSKHAFAGSVTLLLASTALAHADVDANTIWSDWQETVSRFGGTLAAATEEQSGDTLTLVDVSATTEMAGATSKTTYGTITMVEQADGTVVIEVPAEVRSTQDVTVEDKTVKQDFLFANDGLSIVASEEDGVRTYVMDATSISVETNQEAAEDVPATKTVMTLAGMDSTYRSGVGGDADAIEQELSAETLSIAVTTEGGDGEQVDGRYEATAIESAFDGSYGPARTGPLTSLSDLGLTYDGTVSHSGSTLTVKGDSEQGPFAVDGTSGSAEMKFGMSDTSLTYSAASMDPEMTVTSPSFPVPVKLSMAEIATSMTVPTGEVGAEQPFAVGLALREVLVDDAIWAMFDPTGQLPRDPATVSLDMDGTAVMKADIFGDPKKLESLDGAPGDVKTLNLKDLTVTFAGADLKGSGAVTFPEPKPVPEPVGTVNMTLEGGFALLDKLVALGFVPAEQAAFVKGMAGAVSKPVGDDKLESTIEFTEGGGVTANGLPLK